VRSIGNTAVTIVVACLLSCTTSYTSLDDPALGTFKSMYAVDRSQYGMTALPKKGQVHIERRQGDAAREYGYDVMLHIYNKSIHHVAFRVQNGSYQWVGESEVCTGPREYEHPKGRFNEQLVISYFQNVQHQLNGLHVSYFGPDETLKQEMQPLKEVPISKVTSLLKEWGCAAQ
jgi:hypothetical protein